MLCSTRRAVGSFADRAAPWHGRPGAAQTASQRNDCIEDVFSDDRRYAIRINDEFTIDVMPSVADLCRKLN
jgi:hypothetical protein